MYLLDTDVLSASAPTKPQQQQDWLHWQVRASDSLFLSTMTIAEIERGICASLRQGATTKASRLRQWIDAIEHLYGDRILPLDLNVAHMVGMMLDKARGEGASLADLVIAATAMAHGLTLLTRNERHFRPLGIAWLNPFTELPPL